MSQFIKGLAFGLLASLFACNAGTAGLTAGADEDTASTTGELISQALASPDFRAEVQSVGAQSMADYVQALRAETPSSMPEGAVTVVITEAALHQAVLSLEAAAAKYDTVRAYWLSLGVTDADLDPQVLGPRLSQGSLLAEFIPTSKTELGIIGPIVGAVKAVGGGIGSGVRAVGSGIGGGASAVGNSVGGAVNFCKQSLRFLSCKNEAERGDLLLDPEFYEGIAVNPGLFNAGLDVISATVKRNNPVIQKRLKLLKVMSKLGPQIADELRAQGNYGSSSTVVPNEGYPESYEDSDDELGL